MSTIPWRVPSGISDRIHGHVDFDPDDQDVLVVGGGNSACETALDLWRNNVRVTMVVRKGSLKPTVKYWVQPDVSNRIHEGSIAARFETVVRLMDRKGKERLAEYATVDTVNAPTYEATQAFVPFLKEQRLDVAPGDYVLDVMVTDTGPHPFSVVE